MRATVCGSSATRSCSKDDKFKNFPDDRLTVPGNELTTIDEKNVSGEFRAFVHAPFKDDDAGERNDTSLGMQVTLFDGSKKLQALLLGDLSYPIIKRIFEVSKADDLAWNVLLAPHHCSKAVMYWQDEGDDQGEAQEAHRQRNGRRLQVVRTRSRVEFQHRAVLEQAGG